MSKQVITAVLVGLAAAGSAHADTREGWYGGIRIGQAAQRIGSSLDLGFEQQGLTTSSAFSGNSRTYGLMMGNRLNEFFGVEFGYVDLGKFKYTSTVTAPVADTLTGTYSVRGLDFAALVYFPFRRKWAGHIKFGLGLLEARRDASSETNATDPGSGHQRNFAPLGGGGLSYEVNRNLVLRAEYLRYIKIGNLTIGTGDVDQFTIGFTYHLF